MAIKIANSTQNKERFCCVCLEQDFFNKRAPNIKYYKTKIDLYRYIYC